MFAEAAKGHVPNPFVIEVGVQQGRVLSPRLFCAALLWAMRKWRTNMEAANAGINSKMDCQTFSVCVLPMTWYYFCRLLGLVGSWPGLELKQNNNFDKPSAAPNLPQYWERRPNLSETWKCWTQVVGVKPWICIITSKLFPGFSLHRSECVVSSNRCLAKFGIKFCYEQDFCCGR